MEPIKGKQKEKESNKKDTNKLINIFSKYLWFSIVLLLVAIMLNTYINSVPEQIEFAFTTLINLIAAISTAILVSSIFTYVLGTNELKEFMEKGIESIIIRKSFISSMKPEARSDLLRQTLTPTNELKKIYAGIDRYFDEWVDDSVSMFMTQYRSGLIIKGSAYVNKQKNRVEIKTDVYYRAYKVDGKFGDFRIGVDSTESTNDKVVIETPDHKKIELLPRIQTEEEKKEKNIDVIGSELTQIVEIPEEVQHYDYLDIKRTVLEIGKDHWQLFSYRALVPTERLNLEIVCEDGLMIRDCKQYGDSRSFKEPEIIEKSVIVTCNGWLRPGFGVSVLISKKCES